MAGDVIQKIDLFMPVRDHYGVLRYLTIQLSEALQRQGVKTRILEAEYERPKPFLEKIFLSPPDCTLCFNGLLPDVKGNFFCDMIQIPHIACLITQPANFIELVQSQLNIITCIDRFECDFFRGMNFQNTLFMTTAADAKIEFADAPRIYDVVILASLNDYIGIRDSWLERYDPIICRLLEETAERVLTEPDLPIVQALVSTIDSFVRGPVLFDPNSIDFITSLIELEEYINGRNQMEVICSVKGIRVDIFGNAPKSSSWKKFLKENPHIVVHNPVPFEQALEIMKQSKIVVSTKATTKNGGHERIFSALACGALVLTAENIYLREYFRDNENIAFYELGKWNKINEKIKYYLAHDQERKQVAAKGREEVMRSQTWDCRAKDLIANASPLIDKIRIKR